METKETTAVAPATVNAPATVPTRRRSTNCCSRFRAQVISPLAKVAVISAFAVGCFTGHTWLVVGSLASTGLWGGSRCREEMQRQNRLAEQRQRELDKPRQDFFKLTGVPVPADIWFTCVTPVQLANRMCYVVGELHSRPQFEALKVNMMRSAIDNRCAISLEGTAVTQQGREQFRQLHNLPSLNNVHSCNEDPALFHLAGVTIKTREFVMQRNGGTLQAALIELAQALQTEPGKRVWKKVVKPTGNPLGGQLAPELNRHIKLDCASMTNKWLDIAASRVWDLPNRQHLIRLLGVVALGLLNECAATLSDQQRQSTTNCLGNLPNEVLYQQWYKAVNLDARDTGIVQTTLQLDATLPAGLPLITDAGFDHRIGIVNGLKRAAAG